MKYIITILLIIILMLTTLSITLLGFYKFTPMESFLLGVIVTQTGIWIDERRN